MEAMSKNSYQTQIQQRVPIIATVLVFANFGYYLTKYIYKIKKSDPYST